MARKLGERQRLCLSAMIRHGGQWPGAGWRWDSESGTIRILDSLVRRGLVDYNNETKIYTVNDAGRKTEQET